MREASDLTVSPPAQLNTGKRLTEAEKRAIVAAVAVSGSIGKTAEQFGVHRNTVSALCKDVRQVSGSALNPDWKATMLPDAVTAVQAGLRCEDDPYKRGNLGKEVLIGLGIFKSGPDLNVGVQINNTPAELMERWISVSTRVSASPVDTTGEDPDPKE